MPRTTTLADPSPRRAGRLARLALAVAMTSPALDPARAAEPLCRFPGPFARSDPATRTASGAHLSPLRIAADPSVVRDGPRYRMYFTNADAAGRTGIAMAEGADGSVFEPHRRAASPDPVMDLVVAPPAGAWDSPGIETAHVLRAPGARGWLMYYTGNHAPQGSTHFAIGMAESPDGIAWTRRPEPVLRAQNAWERPVCRNAADPLTCAMGGVLEPSVLFDAASGRYRMWYVALGEPRGSFRTYRVGHATSPDGVAWTRNPDPVFPLGAAGAWDSMWTSHVHVVADPRAGFHMFYFGSAPGDYREGVEIQRGAIGHAWSADGIAWQRNPANPILSPRPGGPDAWSLGGPSALFDGNRLRLWYFASPTSGLESQVVLAEAACGG